jgi:hypothetical protein
MPYQSQTPVIMRQAGEEQDGSEEQVCEEISLLPILTGTPS